jgi:protein-disulfide isomerase
MRRSFQRPSWICTSLLAALLVASCGGKPGKDPTYAGQLVTMEDVDDALAGQVQGDRVRVDYTSDDPIKGAAEPLVTIVEWSDFQCPFCGTLAQTLDELVAAYPDDVRLVFRQFPLPMHPDAELGARATLAAQQQGYFWAMHDRLFANRTKMKRDDLVGHAKALGLDVAKFEADLDDPALIKRLERDKAIGGRLGVRGTPAFFVNGVRHGGAMDAKKLAEIIENERTHARALVEAGSERREVYARIMRAARPTGTNPPAAPSAQPPAEADQGAVGEPG